MTDIVETLRIAASHPYNQHGPNEFLSKAADEIERLRDILFIWHWIDWDRMTEHDEALFDEAKQKTHEVIRNTND